MDALLAQTESNIIEAVWTLRRLPDPDSRWLKGYKSPWPHMAEDRHTAHPIPVSPLRMSLGVRPSRREIDDCQDGLDLLLRLPDIVDRKLMYWAAYHQNGERGRRIPWHLVRRALRVTWSRWTLRRRYRNALKWIAQSLQSDT